MAAGAALANAVAQALAPLGIRIAELPLRPDSLRRWIEESEESDGD